MRRPGHSAGAGLLGGKGLLLCAATIALSLVMTTLLASQVVANGDRRRWRSWRDLCGDQALARSNFSSSSGESSGGAVSLDQHPAIQNDPQDRDRGPDIVVVIPTAKRTGTAEAVLLRVLHSFAAALDDPEEWKRPIRRVMPPVNARAGPKKDGDNATTADTVNATSGGPELLALPLERRPPPSSALVIVFNVMPSPDDHPTFLKATREEHLLNHSHIRFVQLRDRATPALAPQTGASSPVMPSYRGMRHKVPERGKVTVIDRMFDDQGTIPGVDIKPHTKTILTDPKRRKQLSDFLSAIAYANSLYPAADVLIWEDDSFACRNFFTYTALLRELTARKSPNYGAVKMGHGGSGHLVNSEHVPTLVPFLFALGFFYNVDISLYKYMSWHRIPDYVADTLYAVHQGSSSTFSGQKWRHLEGCDVPLEANWGTYGECVDDEYKALGLRCTAGSAY